MKRFSFIILSLLLLPFVSYSQKSDKARETESAATSMESQKAEPPVFPFQKTEEEWKQVLSDEAYYVLRKKGTERAFTGAYWDNKEKGDYACAGCNQLLFSSDAKYRSGTGWPSYWEPINPRAIVTEGDYSYGMQQNEVLCSNCGGHLGHVFPDGPRPTGLRYCINSVSLTFKKKEKAKKEE